MKQFFLHSLKPAIPVKLLSFLVLLFVVCSFTINPPYTIEVSFSAKVRNAITDNYVVYFSSVGYIDDSLNIEKAKPAFTTLNQNQIYTLIFKKTGFEDRCVMIDTHISTKKSKIKYFHFDFSVEMDSVACNMKKDFRDFPVTWFRFDEKNMEFKENTVYRDAVHNDLSATSEPQ